MTQLLAICNVHYCAKYNISGSEKDWYGILQIEQSADESLIKKQFRKLALLLHPDKNKFSGAEAAFKLIGEAHRVLTNQVARSQYDLKCKVSVKSIPKPTSHPSNRASSVNSQSDFVNNYKNGSSKFTASNVYQQAQHLTCWTLCSACGFKFQCNKDFVNRMLNCLSCGCIFIARDLGPQRHSWSQFSNKGPCNSSSQQNGDKPFGVHFPHKFDGSVPIPKTGSSQVGDFKKQEKVGAKMHQSKEGFTAQKVDDFSNTRHKKKGVEMPKPTVAKPEVSGTSRNAKKRGLKSVEESDESSETGGGIKVENMVDKGYCNNNTGANSKVNGGHPPRRSSRQKQPVSYKEKLADDDDDFESLYKKSKVTTTTNANKEKVDDEVLKKDNSGGFTTVDVCKKEVEQKASAPLEDEAPKKKRKTGEDAIHPLLEGESSASRKSTRGSHPMLKDHGQVDAIHYKNEDDSIEAIHGCSSSQPKGSSISNDAVEKMNTPKKFEKNDLTTDCLKPRRSPRDFSRSSSQANATSTIDVTKSSSVLTPTSPAWKTPNLECYDFKGEKSEDQFAVDQIWALYCGEGMPKDYAQVKKIEATPDFRLHVALLEVCSRPKDLKLPICCGIFKVKSGQAKIVSCKDVSHRVRADPIGKNRYKIYPRKGGGGLGNI